MRKTLLMSALLLACMGLSAQEYHMKVYNNAFLLYDKGVSAIEEFRFDGTRMNINDENGGQHLNIRDIDSIVFRQESAHIGDTVYITYNGSSVNVVNPFSNSGVEASTNGADVTVNSTMANVPYVVSGSSSNGSLTFNSSNSFYLALSDLSLTSGNTAAINIASPVVVYYG